MIEFLQSDLLSRLNRTYLRWTTSLWRTLTLITWEIAVEW